MDSATAQSLLDLNRRFYDERGREFSDTRLRIQPGVRRILESLHGREDILDLGCGNGSLALELSRRGHRGRYMGVDLSMPLLEQARRATYAFPVQFLHGNLLPPAPSIQTEEASPLTYASRDPLPAACAGWWESASEWSALAAFAVLHHVPGDLLRMQLLRRVRQALAADGVFFLSNWRFSANKRFRARIRPWSSVGLRADAVDPGDYLVEWRRGGKALRYVHEFDEVELGVLASQGGFSVVETFYSDGADRHSGLYQVWIPTR